MRMSRTVGRRSCSVAARGVLAGLVVFLAGWLGPARPAVAQLSLFDPMFEEVRKASAEWDRRPGPARQVVDMVCLVPDSATFLRAISTWDAHHYFPVLIDDVEYSFKFLRAFHPARVVRMPPADAEKLTPDARWEKALAAVGRSWSTGEGAPLRGDEIPRGLGPTPPGVVVSSPDCPTFAGAVALAAGRFQPLIRWETRKTIADTVNDEESRAMVRELEGRIAALCPAFDRLGDDCDFVTLAGNYPFRYTDARNQLGAFDDLILRSSGSHRRWGYAGRITGGPVQSVYRAMCSLFLTPTTAVAINAYDENEKPWSDYVMTGAAARLNQVLPTLHLHGPRANVAAWHSNFDPLNRQGFVMVNSHGTDTDYFLAGGQAGQTSDIPESVPTVVTMLHSFSAVAPDDPETLSGRWLANGAYAYFGAMNEPFLQSFRTPTLVSAFLAENLPLVVSVRKTAAEVFGQPWRLVYLGDPLWRIKSTAPTTPRLAAWEPVAAWPAYAEYRPPEAGASEAVRLNWALKTAIFRLQAGAAPQLSVDVAGVLMGIDRDRLEPRLQAIHDALLSDTLLSANRSAELLDRLTRIPPEKRSRDVRRHLETAQTAALERAAARHDFRQALALWNEVIRARGSRGYVDVFTARVGRTVDTPLHRSDWRDRLRAALRATTDPDNIKAIEAELKRVDEQLGTGGRR